MLNESDIIDNQELPVKVKTDRLLIWSSWLQRQVTVDILQVKKGKHLISKGLLLINDGQDLKELELALSLKKLAATGTIAVPLVIAVHAGIRKVEYGVAGIPDYMGRGAGASHYERFIIDELLPHIYAVTNTPPNPRYTAIAGCSLGGLSALDIATSNPAHFGIAGVLSGSLWWRSKGYNHGYTESDRILFNKIKTLQIPSYFKCWLMAGTNDETCDRNGNGVIDAVDDTLDMYDLLRSKMKNAGLNLQLQIVNGGTHHQSTWKKSYVDFIKFAFTLPYNPLQKKSGISNQILKKLRIQ